MVRLLLRAAIDGPVVLSSSSILFWDKEVVLLWRFHHFLARLLVVYVGFRVQECDGSHAFNIINSCLLENSHIRYIVFQDKYHTYYYQAREASSSSMFVISRPQIE